MRAILSTARLFLAFLLAVAMPQQNFCLANSEFQHQPLVRFAVSLDPPQDKNFAVIDPTLETLKKEFGEQNIRITKYSLPDLEKALKDGEVDVFISTSGLCRRMAQNGARLRNTFYCQSRQRHPHFCRHERQTFGRQYALRLLRVPNCARRTVATGL